MPGDNKPAFPSAAPRSAGRDADARLTPRRRRWLLAQRLGESSSRRHRPAGAGAVDQYDVDRLGDVEDRVGRASLSSSRGAGEGHLLRQCVHLRVHSLPVLRSISTSATIATTAPERREQEMSRGALKPAQAKRDGVSTGCGVLQCHCEEPKVTKQSLPADGARLLPPDPPEKAGCPPVARICGPMSRADARCATARRGGIVSPASRLLAKP